MRIAHSVCCDICGSVLKKTRIDINYIVYAKFPEQLVDRKYKIIAHLCVECYKRIIVASDEGGRLFKSLYTIDELNNDSGNSSSSNATLLV